MTGPIPSSSSKRTQDAAGTKGPDWWLMVRKLMEQGTTIASFAPSSRFLARMILSGIDYERAKCIVELGAGTGPITKELIKRVKPHTKLIVVERDPDFCKRLRVRFPGTDIVEGDAAQIDLLLKERGLEEVDTIVSGLPLPSFPEEVREAILRSSARAIGANGVFRQLTVMPWVYRNLYKRYFADVRFKLVPLNLPPAGVYMCRGFRFEGPLAKGAKAK